jgi:hypothetical protein
MRAVRVLTVAVTLAFAAGCASVQSGGEVQQGRNLLFAADPQAAAGYFRRAADVNPNYVSGFSVFKESVWTISDAPITRAVIWTRPGGRWKPPSHATPKIRWRICIWV